MSSPLIEEIEAQRMKMTYPRSYCQQLGKGSQVCTGDPKLKYVLTLSPASTSMVSRKAAGDTQKEKDWHSGMVKEAHSHRAVVTQLAMALKKMTNVLLSCSWFWRVRV